jgi:hypothetical protein
MGNALPELYEEADFITNTNDEDGCSKLHREKNFKRRITMKILENNAAFTAEIKSGKNSCWFFLRTDVVLAKWWNHFSLKQVTKLQMLNFAKLNVDDAKMLLKNMESLQSQQWLSLKMVKKLKETLDSCRKQELSISLTNKEK